MPTQPPYQPLAKLFHQDTSAKRFSRNEQLADQRLIAPSTFRTGLRIREAEIFLAVPRELSLLTERVLRLERKVSADYQRLPLIARSAIVTDLITEEVVSSNALEHVSSTKHEVFEALSRQRANNHKVGGNPHRHPRFGKFARLYETLTTEGLRPRTPEEVRLIYDAVMDGEELGDDAPDGRLFRARGVDIIGNTGRSIHEGVSGEGAITRGLEQMIGLAEDESIPELYSAIMSHFYFEYLHPFYDGNGRCGRYLLALYLSRPLSVLTSLSLSRMLSEHRDAYYRSFREAENPLNHGELTFFVLNILEDLREAQSRLVISLQVAERLILSVNETLRKLVDEEQLSNREANILFFLVQWECFGGAHPQTWSDIATAIRVSKRGCRASLASLDDRGLIRTVSKNPLSYRISREGLRLIGAAPTEVEGDVL